MGETTHPEITLGPEGHEVVVPVLKQPHAYLLRLPGEFMARAEAVEALGAVLEGASVSEAIGLLTTAADGLVYDLTCALIPDIPKRMSRHEWAGFRTAEDYKADNYNRAEDHSPTVDQIEEAFKVAARLNRFDLLKAVVGPIKGLVGPKEKEDLKTWIRTQFAGNLPSLRSTSGESNQPGSGETPPTSAPGVESTSSEMANGTPPAAGSGNPPTT